MAKLRGKNDYPIYFGAKAEGLRLASDLRRNTTNAENLLWKQLKNKKIKGLRFRRQHPIDEFIVDFFCPKAMLVIELDGGIHDSDAQHERDLERTKILNRHGLKVIRFSNEDIEQNIMEVISRIIENTGNVK